MPEINEHNIYHYDILISSFVSALNSYRKDTVLNPYPEKYLLGNGQKDFLKLESIVKRLPPLKQIAKHGLLSLEESTYDLLNWILDSSTFVITQCKDEEMLKIKMLTKQSSNAPEPNFIFKMNHQIETSNITPLKTYYAYHGSSLENLYSILINGLQPEYSKNGLFGDGIYLSSELSMSLNYSRRGKSWCNSILGKYMSFALVCELTDDGSTQLKYSDDRETPDTYFILRNKDLAKICYLLVYTYPDGVSNEQMGSSISMNNTSRHSWLRRLHTWCRGGDSWLLILLLYAIFLLALATINSNSFRSLINKSFLPFKRKSFPPDIY